jgi:methionyl-tRNA formyltransferase
VPVPQVGEPVYAAKITPDELRIDWTGPAVQIDRLVRLGGAWTTLRDKRVKVLAAHYSPEAPHEPSLEWPAQGLQLVTVQPEGKVPMRFADFARGGRLEPGDHFV